MLTINPMQADKTIYMTKNFFIYSIYTWFYIKIVINCQENKDFKRCALIVSDLSFPSQRPFGDFVVSSSESDGKVRLWYVLLYLMDVLMLFAHFCFVSGVACTSSQSPVVGVEIFCSPFSGFDGTVAAWCGYLVFYVLPDDVVVYLVYDLLDLCLHCVVMLGVM